MKKSVIVAQCAHILDEACKKCQEERLGDKVNDATLEEVTKGCWCCKLNFVRYACTVKVDP